MGNLADDNLFSGLRVNESLKVKAIIKSWTLFSCLACGRFMLVGSEKEIIAFIDGFCVAKVV